MNKPTTLVELDAALSASFECVDGPEKAWFLVEDDPARRVIYQVCAFGVPSTEPGETAIQKLVNAAYLAIMTAVRGHESIPVGAKLYWRARPAINDSNGLTRIRMRLGIEGFSMLGHQGTDAEPTELE